MAFGDALELPHQHELPGSYVVGPGTPWGLISATGWKGITRRSASKPLSLADGMAQGVNTKSRLIVVNLHLNGMTNSAEVDTHCDALEAACWTDEDSEIWTMRADLTRLSVPGRYLDLDFPDWTMPHLGQMVATVTFEPAVAEVTRHP